MNRLLRPMHLILLSLIVVGLGVSPCLSSTPTVAKKKAKSSSSHKGKSAKSGKSSRRQVGQKAPTPQRISEIQQALAKNGAYTLAPNGKWDAPTIEAMKKYQGTRGLNPSGKLDAKTLQQLGLGSQTAGIAPPTPAVRISSANGPQDSPQGNTLSSSYKKAGSKP